MILAIEIGNTYTVLGCVDDEKIHFIERISTKSEETDFEYAVQIKTLFDIYNIDIEKIEGTIISSVVPPMVEILRNAINKILRKPIKIVGPGLKTGINIKMDNPAFVGTDLIVNAVGALQKYEPPFLVVMMGTATTISVIDKNGSYIGGTIMPGLEVALDSLIGNTAQLPQIRMKNNGNVIGKNTAECMQSGVILGAAASIEGLIDRIEEELGYSTTRIVTGIFGQRVVKYINRDIFFDEELSLLGLKAIYNKNK